MARPQKEGLDYFPHDTDAVNDEKLEALRALHGNDGYAFYFVLLERIYRSPNAEIDVSDAETLQILARKVAVTNEKFAEMMNTALKWQCFDVEKYNNHHILTSNGVKKRVAPVIEKRLNMRLKYQTQTVTTPVSVAETTHKLDKVKESKVKERIVYIYSFWNKQEIIKHKKLTEYIKRAIKTALDDYKPEVICQAISNYAEILKGDEYYFRYAWTLKDFLKRGIDKFLDSEIAKSNYLKEKGNAETNKGNTGSSSRAKGSDKENSRNYTGGKYGRIIKS